MKLQTTKKAIKNGFYTVISIGYCGAQDLLYFKNPFAYSAGIYGWACDYYQIKNICICTGYSPFGKNVDYKKLNELEKKASEIVQNYDIEQKDKESMLDALLNELISL
jgi:hypothetical protein